MTNMNTLKDANKNASLTVQWVTPDDIPAYSIAEGGSHSDWHALTGHGYFVSPDSNHSLVLVHPKMSDNGLYICRVMLEGRLMAEVRVATFVIVFFSFNVVIMLLLHNAVKPVNSTYPWD
jgi:hypothetical protein